MSDQHEQDFSDVTGYTLGDRTEYGESFFSDEDYRVCLQVQALAAARFVSLREAARDMTETSAIHRMEDFLRAYKAYKDGQSLHDFLDMLTGYMDNPVPLPVEVVFLDEAQDLSKLQWQIFRHMISEAKRVYIAGDDDQSIYNFIGADPDTFNQFPADRVRVLTQSYRVPALIGRKADSIIRRVKNRQPKDITWKANSGVMAVADSEPLNWNLRPGKTALVLCRHRHQVIRVSNELMPFVPHSVQGKSICNSPHSHLFKWHQRLLAGEAIPVVVMREDDPTKVKERPIARIMRYFGIKNWLPVDQRTHYKLADLPQLQRFKPLWSSGRSKADRDIFANLYGYTRRYGETVLNKSPAVNVMTMHAAKGMEADDVFILPDCNARVYDSRTSDAERRLQYVALTRAKERCLICKPHSGTYLEGLFG